VDKPRGSCPLSSYSGQIFEAGTYPRELTLYTNLNCAALFGRVPFEETVELAVEFGFGGVAPDMTALLERSPEQIAELRERIRARGLQFGASGISFDPTAAKHEFDDGLKCLEAQARAMEAAGIDRVVRWIKPMSDTRTYRANFELHASRLRAIAEVLRGHGIRLGLEYVGPKTKWSSARFPFIHTLVEARELIDKIGSGNVGLCLDSFHWYTAGENADDIRGLSDQDVVSVDINDAHSGLNRHEQQDLQRELPARTGIINLAEFIGALRDINYSGPIQVEPFNARLREIEPRQAIKETADALKDVLQPLPQ
jgi:sugar phosphate isomerase/epimerase